MNLQLYIFITHADCSTFTIMKLLSSVCCCLHCARFMKTAVLMLWQTHVLLLWQQQCQLSSHLAQGALCESFSYDHMKCQLKPIPVLVTTLVMKSYHCHGDRKMEFVVVVCLYPTTALEAIN